MSPFQECDIRGVYGQDIDEEFATRLGNAVGRAVRDGKAVVAGDYRIHTPALMESLIGGLLSAGMDVIACGQVPTPVYYFARDRYAVSTGVMVTASHNPPEYAGFKPILGSLPITPSELAHLEIAMAGEHTAREPGRRTHIDPVPAYEEAMGGLARRLLGPSGQRLRLVVDSGNGCFGPIAPRVLEELGFEVVSLFAEPDGRFPNRPSDVALEAGRRPAAEAVRSSGADLGVAYDGDGDRVAFIDNRGRPVSNDIVIALLAQDALAESPGATVIHDIKCSRIVAEAIARAGGVAKAERSGHTFMKTAMIEKRAAFGGELSGHLFFAELGGRDDALYATIRMAALLARRGTDLASLVDATPTYVTTPDIRVEVEGDRAATVADIGRRLALGSDCRLTTADGIRADWADGWGLIRLSVTEPVVTLRFEAETREGLDRIVDRFLAATPGLRERVLKAIGRWRAL